MPSIFFRELQLITVLLLIFDFCKSCNAMYVSLKLCVRFSNFDKKFIFLFNKIHGLFDFKTW